MKRCPTCTRTFLDEQLSFCTDDGTPLVDQHQSSSFDPQATVLNQEPPNTNDINTPSPTRPFRADDMPGGWPAPHAWSEPSRPYAPVAPPSPWGAPAQPPSQWTPPPPPVGRFASSKTQYNPVAISSLAVGVFSLTIGMCCYVGIGAGPIAIILGVVALGQLKNSTTQASSKGMAIAGIATGATAFLITILLITLGVALGSFR